MPPKPISENTINPCATPVSLLNPSLTPLPNFSDDHSSSCSPATLNSPLPLIPSKPVLEAPRLKTNTRDTSSSNIRRVFNVIERVEKVGEQSVEFNQNTIDLYLKRMHALNQQEAEELQKALKHSQDSSFWGFLKELGALLLAAVSAVLGLSLLSTGAAPLIGGALIASGVLSIANFTFKTCGVWDWVAELLAQDNEALRKQLAHLLPAGAGLLAALISLAGIAGAAWYAKLDLGQKVLAIVQTATSFTTGFASMAQGISEGRKNWVESELVLIKGKTELMRVALTKAMTQMEEACDTQSQITKSVKQVVLAARRAIQIIHHNV